MNAGAEKVVQQLGLVPLPGEGGYFARTWLSPGASRGRRAGSAIYFLLTTDDFSALHRLRTDEIWHFYAGDDVEHVHLNPRDGTVRTTVLGVDILAGQLPQLVVPAGHWQGARLVMGAKASKPGAIRAGWALLGCTLAPAWDPNEFELGQRSRLVREFPSAAALVRALTR
jgi:uncharacterized protein